MEGRDSRVVEKSTREASEQMNARMWQQKIDEERTRYSSPARRDAPC